MYGVCLVLGEMVPCVWCLCVCLVLCVGDGGLWCCVYGVWVWLVLGGGVLGDMGVCCVLCCGVWCLVLGVWCLVSGVWCVLLVVCGVGSWCLVFGVWCVIGVWSLVWLVFCLFGVCV